MSPPRRVPEVDPHDELFYNDDILIQHSYPKSRQSYTHKERVKILQYIKKTSGYNKVNGNALWKEIEEKEVCPRRTWQSMREHFRRYIVHHLEQFPSHLTDGLRHPSPWFGFTGRQLSLVSSTTKNKSIGMELDEEGGHVQHARRKDKIVNLPQGQTREGMEEEGVRNNNKKRDKSQATVDTEDCTTDKRVNRTFFTFCSQANNRDEKDEDKQESISVVQQLRGKGEGKDKKQDEGQQISVCHLQNNTKKKKENSDDEINLQESNSLCNNQADKKEEVLNFERQATTKESQGFSVIHLHSQVLGADERNNSNTQSNMVQQHEDEQQEPDSSIGILENSEENISDEEGTAVQLNATSNSSSASEILSPSYQQEQLSDVTHEMDPQSLVMNSNTSLSPEIPLFDSNMRGRLSPIQSVTRKDNNSNKVHVSKRKGKKMVKEKLLGKEMLESSQHMERSVTVNHETKMTYDYLSKKESFTSLRRKMEVQNKEEEVEEREVEAEEKRKKEEDEEEETEISEEEEVGVKKKGKKEEKEEEETEGSDFEKEIKVKMKRRKEKKKNEESEEEEDIDIKQKRKKKKKKEKEEEIEESEVEKEVEVKKKIKEKNRDEKSEESEEENIETRKKRKRKKKKEEEETEGNVEEEEVKIKKKSKKEKKKQKEEETEESDEEEEVVKRKRKKKKKKKEETEESEENEEEETEESEESEEEYVSRKRRIKQQSWQPSVREAASSTSVPSVSNTTTVVILLASHHMTSLMDFWTELRTKTKSSISTASWPCREVGDSAEPLPRHPAHNKHDHRNYTVDKYTRACRTFTVQEDLAILKYIEENNEYSRVGGNAVWNEMSTCFTTGSDKSKKQESLQMRRQQKQPGDVFTSPIIYEMRSHCQQHRSSKIGNESKEKGIKKTSKHGLNRKQWRCTNNSHDTGFEESETEQDQWMARQYCNEKKHQQQQDPHSDINEEGVLKGRMTRKMITTTDIHAKVKKRKTSASFNRSFPTDSNDFEIWKKKVLRNALGNGSVSKGSYVLKQKSPESPVNSPQPTTSRKKCSLIHTPSEKCQLLELQKDTMHVSKTYSCCPSVDLRGTKVQQQSSQRRGSVQQNTRSKKQCRRQIMEQRAVLENLDDSDTKMGECDESEVIISDKSKTSTRLRDDSDDSVNSYLSDLSNETRAILYRPKTLCEEEEEEEDENENDEASGSSSWLFDIESESE
ncbi:inner centromere protein A-like isoform X3 [Scylla paramamosain]|uniref:inner centromere protein A-like isoform X3 n=1 Tax=Scylla paramamosain TaxID=85552 RepID=UPI003083B5AA